jgi:hypothetical protein
MTISAILIAVTAATLLLVRSDKFPELGVGRQAASAVYVHCVSGNDANAGTTTAPLRTIRKATANTLAAGTTIWLARGCSWEGPISMRGNGVAAAPITLGAYGTGAAPTVTGKSLTSNQSILWMPGAYQRVSGIHFSHAAGPAIVIGGVHATVTGVEIDDVGIGVRLTAAFGLVQATNVHDLHMVVNTPGGDDDYGAVGFDVQATDVEVTGSRCTNCRAPSFDFGYDGGFVEVWNYGDRLSVHDNVGQNTTGIFEIGGDAANGSARNITLRANTFRAANGGIWIHGKDHFTIPVANLLVSANTISNTSSSDPEVLGGDLTNLDFRGNTVTTPAQVSWSGAPASHTSNTYHVAGLASIGYPLHPTETLVPTPGAQFITPPPAAGPLSGRRRR